MNLSLNLRLNRMLILLLVCVPVLAPVQAADIYPSRAIKLIIPFPPGGSNDVVGRVIAAQLAERLGQPVVVDNKGGAGGLIGSEQAAKAEPDGYTLLFVSSAFAANASLYKLPYDQAKAFVPVAMIAAGPNVLVVTPSLPVNSVKELIALAKSKPGSLNYASAGIGSFQHLGSALFTNMAKVDIVNVPFKGGGPAMMDVMAGNTQIMLSSLVQTLPSIKSGKLKALAVGGTKRSPTLPDVPTMAEAGVPGYEAVNWWGVMAPTGTPKPALDRLYKELTAIQKLPEIVKRFEAEAVEAVPMTPVEFGRYIEQDTAKWARVVKEAGIKPQ
ncbi:MAG: tripartite tricarboxylate transporter substrate binding protein [Burkholderiaceae bacterium]